MFDFRFHPMHSGRIVRVALPDRCGTMADKAMSSGIEILSWAGEIRRYNRFAPTSGLEKRIIPSFSTMKRHVTVAALVQSSDLFFAPRFRSELDASLRRNPA